MEKVYTKRIKAILTSLGRRPIIGCTLDSSNCLSLARSRLRSHFAGVVLDEFYYGRFAITINLVTQDLDITTNQNLRVLDVGCANGDLLILLSKFLSTHNLIGLDYRRDPTFPSEFDMLNTTVPPLPIRTCSLDLITCIGTTEHILNEEKFIDEVHRVLKPKGMYVCTMPVETGSAGLLRHIVKNLIYPDRTDCKSIFDYSLDEFMGRCLRQKHGTGHKYYNYKYLLSQLRSQFSEISVHSWPRYWPRLTAPLLFAKCIK